VSSARITLAGAELFAAQMFGQAVTPAEEYWIGLCLTSPTVSMTGIELDEPNDTPTYVRQRIGNNSGSWGTDSNLQRYNTVTLLFPAATVDWGIVKYWAMCSEDTEGLVYAFGDVVNPVDVKAGEDIAIGVGAMSFSMNVLFQVPA